MKKTKGKFDVTGIFFVDKDTKKMIVEKIKNSSVVILRPDIGNQFDEHAIEVLYDNVHIGWYQGTGYRKKELFDELVKGTPIFSIVSDLYTRGIGRIDMKIHFEYEHEDNPTPKSEPKQIDMEEYRVLEEAIEKIKKL